MPYQYEFFSEHQQLNYCFVLAFRKRGVYANRAIHRQLIFFFFFASWFVLTPQTLRKQASLLLPHFYLQVKIKICQKLIS